MKFAAGVILGLIIGAIGTWGFRDTDSGRALAVRTDAYLDQITQSEGVKLSGEAALDQMRDGAVAASKQIGGLAKKSTDYVGVLTVAGAESASAAWQTMPDIEDLSDTVTGWQSQLHEYEKNARMSASEMAELFRPPTHAAITTTGFSPHAVFYRCPVIEVANAGRVGNDRTLLDYTPWVSTPAGALIRAPVEGACLSSGYGNRGAEGTRKHAGIDYYNREGGAIYASGDGTVTFAGEDVAYGNSVRIDHGNGVESHYAHMVPGSLRVKAGDTVKLGQTIGMMGTSGRSYAVHLHYELRVDGALVDPLQTGKLASL